MALNACDRKNSWAARFVSRTASVILVRRWLDSLPISFATIWRADPDPPAVRGDGEVEDVQLGLVQLVDHEADDPLAVLGHHADAVPLPQAAEEVFLGPGELEALLLGPQDLRHVPADHPADVDADLFLRWRTTRAHRRTPPPAARCVPVIGDRPSRRPFPVPSEADPRSVRRVRGDRHHGSRRTGYYHCPRTASSPAVSVSGQRVSQTPFQAISVPCLLTADR